MPGTSIRRARAWAAAVRRAALAAMVLVPAGGTPVRAAGPSDFFVISVVDEATGRGVPLVELTTTNGIRCWTDSNGLVAFHEPGLMNTRVFFTVRSHGYEFPKDGFGMAGKALDVRPGGQAELRIRRLNIAERLYRVTGQGIYADSLLAGRPVPLKHPAINALVMGSDSVQHVFYRGLNRWFWGDTNWPAYPLGNFKTTGATSRLPADGGLDPAVGIDLEYFVNEKTGFAREMTPHPETNPVWIDALVVLPDENGTERMYTAYSRVTPAMETIERGIMRYDDGRDVFEKIVEFDLKAPAMPCGHPFRHADGGVDYLWFPAPFPLVRVEARLEAYLDPGRCQAYTCLVEGSRMSEPKIDRAADGTIRYAWRRDTPPVSAQEAAQLIQAGLLKPHEALIQLQDVETGKAIMPHAGSVYWNDYRGRWITIRCEIGGTSMLGETWYAEADTPLGPWVYARKIVTHDRYSFYNPRHHPVFDQQGGRIIYFEGTYTYTFSGNDSPTPRYDYNQIMYRLDLGDQRLVLPVPVYDVSDGRAEGLVTRRRLGRPAGSPPIAFFACDRSRSGLVPVGLSRDGDGPARLIVLDPQAPPETVAFYALPADMADPPATTTPLWEFVDENGAGAYTADESWTRPGFKRTQRPLCRVWKNPTTLRFPL